MLRRFEGRTFMVTGAGTGFGAYMIADGGYSMLGA